MFVLFMHFFLLYFCLCVLLHVFVINKKNACNKKYFAYCTLMNKSHSDGIL